MSTQIPPSTARRVIDEVCAAVDYVTPDDVTSNIRFHRVVRARQAAMAILAVRCQTAGLSVLARAVGRADHSTVINAMRVVGRECGFSIRAHGPNGAPKAEAVPDAFFRAVIEWVSRVPISNDHATHIRAKTKAAQRRVVIAGRPEARV